MTVRDLIEHLSEQDPEEEVVISDEDSLFLVDYVTGSELVVIKLD